MPAPALLTRRPFRNIVILPSADPLLDLVDENRLEASRRPDSSPSSNAKVSATSYTLFESPPQFFSSGGGGT